MKKITTIAAMLGLGCLGAFEMPKVDVNTSVGFDTEYVYRGAKRAQQTFLPKAEMSLAIFEGAKLYFGVESALPLSDIECSAVKNTIASSGISPDLGAVASLFGAMFDGKYSFARTDLYIGMTYSISDMFTVDAGYDHYFYTNTKSMPAYIISPKRDMNEVYLGVIANVIASPSIYVSYDFDCHEFAVEGKVGYTLDLGRFGLNNFAADFSGNVGFDRADRPFGVKDIHQASNNISNGAKDYFYYGVGADLVYSLSDSAKIRAGVAYEGNSANKESFINRLSCWDTKKGHKNMIFFRSSVDCAF